jgi:hypothetical protein
MAKPSKADTEFHPDAWARFERAVDVVAKSPPQHRSAGKPKNKKAKSAAKPKSSAR